MNQTEKLTEAVMGVVSASLQRPSTGWAPLRKRIEAAIVEQLQPPAPLASALEDTAKALDDGKLYTTHDVAKMFQVDASTVAKWIDKGALVAFRTPGGHRRVRARDLRAFAAKHGMPITGELAA